MHILDSQKIRSPSEPPGDRPAEQVMRFFAFSDEALSLEGEIEARISACILDFLCATNVSSDIELPALAERFVDSTISAEPGDIGSYLESLRDNVVAHSIRMASPRYLAHMNSALPSFVRPLSKLMTAMNQNMVKMESSKAVSLYERQAMAMMHRLVYDGPEDFYRQHIQRSGSTLGSIVSDGTLANITALWCARNASFAPKDGFRGIEQEGLPAALECYGYRGAVILGSTCMHYSFEKAADILGIGAHHVIHVPTDDHDRLDVHALRRVIAECRSKNLRIMAIVGIAGTTTTGVVDPLAEMAEIAHAANTYFHVDAAWGGPLLFSERHRHLLAGIELADSVTIDGHKQLYLPIGLGMVLLRDPQLAQIIEKQTHYILRERSVDLGKRTLEGSRACMALFLHTALHCIGRKGYAWLMDEGIRKAQYMASSIRAWSEFELLAEPETNILLYRYLPEPWRGHVAREHFTEVDNDAINQVNERLQKVQRQAGHSLVSRTLVHIPRYGRDVPLVALRAVVANPRTTEADIDAVLDEQVKIASGLTR